MELVSLTDKLLGPNYLLCGSLPP